MSSVRAHIGGRLSDPVTRLHKTRVAFLYLRRVTDVQVAPVLDQAVVEPGWLWSAERADELWACITVKDAVANADAAIHHVVLCHKPDTGDVVGDSAVDDHGTS